MIQIVPGVAPIPDPLLTNYLVVSLASFAFGAIVGWVWATHFDGISQPQLRRATAVTLLVTYIISVLAEIILKSYATPVMLHTIVGGIVGYLFSQEKDFTLNLG